MQPQRRLEPGHIHLVGPLLAVQELANQSVERGRQLLPRRLEELDLWRPGRVVALDSSTQIGIDLEEPAVQIGVTLRLHPLVAVQVADEHRASGVLRLERAQHLFVETAQEYHGGNARRTAGSFSRRLTIRISTYGSVCPERMCLRGHVWRLAQPRGVECDVERIGAGSSVAVEPFEPLNRDRLPVSRLRSRIADRRSSSGEMSEMTVRNCSVSFVVNPRITCRRR